MPRISKAATYGSDSAERRVAKVINGSWPVLEGFTGTDIAHEMIRMGNAEGFIRNMPWDAWTQGMGGVVEPMSRQITNSIRDQLKNFPRSVDGTINFNVIDSLSVRYAQTQSSQLIKNLSDSQRATVRQVMGEALQGNLTVDQAARRIRSTIGLHPAWAQAVVNYEERQLKALGKTMAASKAAETAAKRAGRYKESLTRKRSLMVARTEIHISSGLGRLAANKTAIDHGYAGTDSRKEWSAGPNACKICTGLSGETTKWDQPYSNGEMIAHAHPGCRCADVFLPAEYGDADLDPEVMNWLDDPDGVGASRFDVGGLTAGIMGDAMVSTATATLAPVQTGVTTGQLEQMAEEYSRGASVERALEGGNMNLSIDVVKLPNGEKAVRKVVKDKHEADTEYLSGRVLNALGVDVKTARLGDTELLTDYIDGFEMRDYGIEFNLPIGPDAYKDAIRGMKNSKEVAIFDRIAANTDRHVGNFLISKDGKTLYPIDHGMTEFDRMYPGHAGPAGKWLAEQALKHPGWVAKADLEKHRVKLAALESEFAEHPEWHAQMMKNLDKWIGQL